MTGPLDGIRILTFTQAWSGTFATELLGFLGADVIQIEARRRPDTWRGGYERPIPAAVAGARPGQRPWNLSGLYNAVNLNKRGITLDLSYEPGQEIFRRLVALSDVLVDNFSPRVMQNWGVDLEMLEALRPGIIWASLSAYGASGPYENVPGIGGTIEPMSGITSLQGYEDGPPLNSGAMYPDPVSGFYFASSILLALRHRGRTGQGQRIDLGMMEASATFTGDAFLEYAVNGRVRPRLGNRHLRMAPHNVYPTQDGGWIAIAAETDEAWAALARCLGRQDLAAIFAKEADRKAQEPLVDEAVEAWTRTQDAASLEATLLEAGVTAAAVRGRRDAYDAPPLTARDWPQRVDHPEAGEHVVPGVPWKFRDHTVAVQRPAPMLGEHSAEVFAELLGIEQDEYVSLVQAGVTGDGPPD